MKTDAGPLAHRRKYPRPWRILIEAALALLTARIALRVVPTARIVRWIRRPLSLYRLTSPEEVEQIYWSVAALSRRSPVCLVCFPQALAMHAMLRRRGVASEVLYGANRLGDGTLVTHAWLRTGDRTWVGAEVAQDFTVLDVWAPLGLNDACGGGRSLQKHQELIGEIIDPAAESGGQPK